MGLNNYHSLLHYSAFWKAIGNTLFYFLVHLLPVMGFAFLFAVLLQSERIGKIRSVFKPILFLPQVVPVMASVLTFRVIFSTYTGAINQVFGLTVSWLDDPNIMRWTVVAYSVWRSTGWFMIIYLAGLTTINPSLYEAAILDGATSAQRIFYITIPMMRSIFLFAFIMDAISSFKVYTEVNVLLAGVGNAPTHAAPIMNLVTSNMKNGNFGMSSAAGWLLFLMILVISLVELLLMREKED
ncbi:MAG: sugar ABC transporter permease [Eubacteriales bacterium]|nr:sugar ABC transporter permease [Eubacteriales bacterium]